MDYKRGIIKMFEYAYKLRPPAPACQPKDNLIKVVSFDCKKDYKGVECWGYALYSEKIKSPEKWDLKLIKGDN